MTVAPTPTPGTATPGTATRDASPHDPAVCPSCGAANGCRVDDARRGGRCWCFDVPPAACASGARPAGGAAPIDDARPIEDAALTNGAEAVSNAEPVGGDMAPPLVSCLCPRCLARRRAADAANTSAGDRYNT